MASSDAEDGHQKAQKSQKGINQWSENMVLKPPVHLSAVPHLHDQHKKNLALNLINYPVVAHSQAVEVFHSSQLFRFARLGIICESVDLATDALLNAPG
jgi:hypothetical protein